MVTVRPRRRRQRNPLKANWIRVEATPGRIRRTSAATPSASPRRPRTPRPETTTPTPSPRTQNTDPAETPDPVETVDPVDATEAVEATAAVVRNQVPLIAERIFTAAASSPTRSNLSLAAPAPTQLQAAAAQPIDVPPVVSAIGTPGFYGAPGDTLTIPTAFGPAFGLVQPQPKAVDTLARELTAAFIGLLANVNFATDVSAAQETGVLM